MALEPISTAYFINPSRQSVCLYVYSPTVARRRLGKNFQIVARQRLGKNVDEATNSYTTTKDLLDASFSMRSVSYQRKRAILTVTSCYSILFALCSDSLTCNILLILNGYLFSYYDCRRSVFVHFTNIYTSEYFYVSLHPLFRSVRIIL
jgi:hypothetical protein